MEVSLHRLFTLKYQKFHIKPSIYLLIHIIIAIGGILVGILGSKYFLLDNQVGKRKEKILIRDCAKRIFG